MSETNECVAPTNELVAALAKAQSKITCPERNREVEVKTKKGYSYKFRYTTLDCLIDRVRKPLTENGLWFVQTLEGTELGKYHLVTRLMHSSGQSIESRTPLLVEEAGNQAFGSALTYMRRYALTAMLGIAADEDDDGNAGDGNAAKQSTPQRRKQPPKQKPQEHSEGYEKQLSQCLECIGKVGVSSENVALDATSALAIISESPVDDSREVSLKALTERVELICSDRISKIETAEQANAELAIVKAIPPEVIGNVKRKLMDKTKEMAFEFDDEAMAFKQMEPPY